MREHIKQSNLIEGISDPKEIKQSLVAWEYLHDQYMPLTHGVICTVQKIITLNQTDLQAHMRGYYRNMSEVNVRVGNYFPPDYKYVEGQMETLLRQAPMIDPWTFHVEFERIHPFVDGNGRTGRMIMWWQEVGGGNKPTLIKNADKQDYYARLAGE